MISRNLVINKDIILMEKSGNSGLTFEDIVSMTGFIETGTEVLPIEVYSLVHETSAMGFITTRLAEELEYEFEANGLTDFVRKTLDSLVTGKVDYEYNVLHNRMIYEDVFNTPDSVASAVFLSSKNT